jgi:hypothetical protein
VLALTACFFASAYAIIALEDSHPSDLTTAPWWAIAAELVMCLIALGTLVIGSRFLSFALTGRNSAGDGRWLKPILLGMGLFFPVFFVSLGSGLYWAYHVQSHENPDDNALLALKVSSYAGVAAAIIGSAVLLRRARSRR